jgi:hypothetical protein
VWFQLNNEDTGARELVYTEILIYYVFRYVLRMYLFVPFVTAYDIVFLQSEREEVGAQAKRWKQNHQQDVLCEFS